MHCHTGSSNKQHQTLLQFDFFRGRQANYWTLTAIETYLRFLEYELERDVDQHAGANYSSPNATGAGSGSHGAGAAVVSASGGKQSSSGKEDVGNKKTSFFARLIGRRSSSLVRTTRGGSSEEAAVLRSTAKKEDFPATSSAAAARSGATKTASRLLTEKHIREAREELMLIKNHNAKNCAVQHDKDQQNHPQVVGWTNYLTEHLRLPWGEFVTVSQVEALNTRLAITSASSSSTSSTSPGNKGQRKIFGREHFLFLETVKDADERIKAGNNPAGKHPGNVAVFSSTNTRGHQQSVAGADGHVGCTREQEDNSQHTSCSWSGGLLNHFKQGKFASYEEITVTNAFLEKMLPSVERVRVVNK